ncbi:hypothetical protein [Cellulomonas sp. Root137]|uniref:hypothetical protein n=1 Tax=Cellulomonas sp. Root137 TaxID=1736459 RepID=UPI0006F95603|nr:hypothetical protein [Cellulomonas sp. Root137]KQY47979.1 hypothetical protein ASD18_12190 [Cellulomonas sp. Root137]
MTTYGELVTKAAQCIHEGSARTQYQRFDTIDDAYQALIGFHAVLDAVERHVRSLADWNRIGTLYGVPPGLRTGDPVEYAAVQMVDTIPWLEDKDRRLPYVAATNDHPWARAAQLLRAGAELLSTHISTDGLPRTPDAATVTDFAARRIALGRIADLADALLAGEMSLALRAGQAGVTWWRLRRWLPDLGEARAWAARAVSASNQRSGSGPLDRIGLAHAPIRDDDPVAELSGLVGRLRNEAWSNMRHPDRSVATLRDFALIGLAANAAHARLHALDGHPIPENVARWQTLVVDLRHLLAPGPGNPVVHAAVPAARLLTGRVLTVVEAQGRDAVAVRSTGATLRQAADATAEIAAWNAETFRVLAVSGQLHIRGGELTGDQVTDSPDLVRAKLQGASVPLPEAIRDKVLDDYRALRRENATQTSLTAGQLLSSARQGGTHQLKSRRISGSSRGVFGM